MTEKLLITQDDIAYYVPSAEFDESKINSFIRESQVEDLQPVLNAALYLDFLKKFDDGASADYTKYRDLLQGKEYTVDGQTILFEGVRPMLVYFSAARYVERNPVNITRFGVVTKVVQNSTPVDPNLLRSVVNSLRSTAITYQNGVIDYLCNNSTTYPLYSYRTSSGSATRTSFNFFKA